MVDIQILIALLFTLLPFIELRGGLPIIVEYATRNGFSVWPYFLVVLILNILLIFLVFMFLDFLHEIFMKLKWYRIVVGHALRKAHRKAEKVKGRMDKWGYLALMSFVAVPLPGTGVWAGAMIAWIIGLDRLKSFVAIAAGVVIAGLIILLLSFGFFSFY